MENVSNISRITNNTHQSGNTSAAVINDTRNTVQTLLTEQDNEQPRPQKYRPKSPPLPSLNERLGHLRPSRELLEYYRKKIAEFDNEHDEMLQKLETYKCTYEEQHQIQWELRQREEEIAELQKALSDMQVYLFQEREHVLRLYSENDRLKIRELEDRKKIQKLLSLSGLTEREVSYFLKEPPTKAIVAQKLPDKWKQDRSYQGTTGEVDHVIQPWQSVQILHSTEAAVTPNKTKSIVTNNTKKQNDEQAKKPVRQTPEEQRYHHDNQTLVLQVEALQAQLQEQTKLAKEQLDAMLEDRRVKIEEYDTRLKRDSDKIQTLTEKLHKTQDLLYDSTRDYLSLKYEGRENERMWMSEKDKLLRDLDLCKQQLHIPRDDILNVSESAYDNRRNKDEELQALSYQHDQATKLADMYREQVIQLEDELSKIREEGTVGKELFKERSEKMAKRLELMNQRYSDLERRRNLEVEGFKTDIRQLRNRLKELEKQLYKVTMGLAEDLEGQRPEDIDMLILRNVRRTAGRSKDIMSNLKTLKAKVYGLENDLRHL